VLAWEPPDRLVLIWQITAQWQYDPAFSTEIEVGFFADGPRRTRVELEHKQLENYGAAAEQMKKTFDADDAWVGLLAAFARTAVQPKYLMTYDTSPEGLAKVGNELGVAIFEDFVPKRPRLDSVRLRRGDG
jgi:hypothetical protein